MEQADGFVIFSMGGPVIAWNDRVLELLNLPPGTLDARDPALFIAALAQQVADEAAYRQGLEHLVSAGSNSARIRLLLKDGRTIERTIIVREPEAMSVAFYRDVTRMVEDERRLALRDRQQASLARLSLRALDEISGDQLCAEVTDEVCRALDVSDAWIAAQVPGGFRMRAASGRRRDDFLGRHLPVEEMTLSASTLATRRPNVVADARTDTRFPSLRGSGFISGAEVPIFQRGIAAGVLGVCRAEHRPLDEEDVEFLASVANVVAAFLAREASNVALRRSEASFRSLTESSPDLIIVHRGDTVVYMNPAAWRALELDGPEEGVGRSLRSFTNPADVRDDPSPPPPTPDGLRPRREIRSVGKRGSQRILEVLSMPTELDGQPAVLAIGHDLTEQRELQLKLQLADRLASVGTLAAGVAHELNNPLAYVSANLGFLDDHLRHLLPQLAGSDAARATEALQALREAQDGADRMAVIVRDLRSFARGPDEQQGRIDVVEVLRSTAKMAQNELRQRARLVLQLDPAPAVLGNTARLGQVFLNLLINAAQAIPPGAPELNEVVVRTGTEPDGQALISVTDTGTGIPEAVLPHIFDPFFTTKPVGVGTGLGLSVSHAIVTGLGGTVEVATKAGAGTTFTVRLPPTTLPMAATRPPEVRAQGPRRRVLIIDDEPMVASAIQRALSTEHEVTVEPSVASALARLRSGESFDALVSDLLMPGQSGMDLNAILKTERPELARRTLFLTGGAFTNPARVFLAQPGLSVLEKPFKLDELRVAVRACLER